MTNVACGVTNVARGMTNVACGIMFDAQGNILMGLRDSRGPNPNYWEFPGGQLESNETLEECLRREWVEELNLHICIDRFLCTTTFNNISCHFFVGKIEDIENLRIQVHQYIGFCSSTPQLAKCAGYATVQCWTIFPSSLCSDALFPVVPRS
jgi:8-oxo-dGTP pyrophosphatase MutT (NUDIX family)